MSGDTKVFQYVQFKSMVAPDFWYKLAGIKLEVERLEEGRRRVFGVRIALQKCYRFVYKSVFLVDLQQLRLKELLA